MDFVAWGEDTVRLVLAVSELLRERYSPGVVSLGLVLLLLLACSLFGRQTWRRCAALRKFRGVVRQHARNPAEFYAGRAEVTREMEADAERRGPKSSVSLAWREYSETFVEHPEEHGTVLRNSVRPSLFFNLDDLHFGPGFWRVMPGLFVTVGLFLTFLGLISALGAMQDEGAASEEAMTNLLGVASAKFIMSLTGLLCSIVFTAVLRLGMGRVEHGIGELNRLIEDRLSFLSLESLAVEQLDATREQREHFRRIGMEMVEELGRPLREDLPQTISESIGNAVSPLIRQVGELGTSSVGDMVRDLSGRISADVEGALGQASERLATAGDRIGELVTRMDASSGRMGSEFEGASERLGEAVGQLRETLTAGATDATGALSEGVEAILGAMRVTLEGIRANTAEGASAMSKAAGEMRVAAEGWRREIREAAEEGAVAARGRMHQAGREVRGVIEETGRDLAKIAAEVSARTGEDLLAPINDVAEQLKAMVDALESGAVQMVRASDGVQAGADASSRAAGTFRASADALVAASGEVAPAVVRLETAARDLARSTHDVALGTRNNTDSAAQVLDTAREALGGHRRAIEATLTLLGQNLERMQGQGDRLDAIDQKLGKAFEEYRDQVRNAQVALRQHVADIQGDLTPALDKMREIVEQAEAFVPQSGRS